MKLELDVYEYCHKLKIVNGQFKEIVWATLALLLTFFIVALRGGVCIYMQMLSDDGIFFCPR